LAFECLSTLRESGNCENFERPKAKDQRPFPIPDSRSAN
jgi:hypothetical protein